MLLHAAPVAALPFGAVDAARFFLQQYHVRPTTRRTMTTRTAAIAPIVREDAARTDANAAAL